MNLGAFHKKHEPNPSKRPQSLDITPAHGSSHGMLFDLDTVPAHTDHGRLVRSFWTSCVNCENHKPPLNRLTTERARALFTTDVKRAGTHHTACRFWEMSDAVCRPLESSSSPLGCCDCETRQPRGGHVVLLFVFFFFLGEKVSFFGATYQWGNGILIGHLGTARGALINM